MRSLSKNLLSILWYSNLQLREQRAEVVRRIECRREGRKASNAIRNVHSVRPVHSECDVGDELPIKGVREREGSDMGLAAKRALLFPRSASLTPFVHLIAFSRRGGIDLEGESRVRANAS